MASTLYTRAGISIDCAYTQDNPAAGAGRTINSPIPLDWSSTVASKMHRKTYTVSASSSQSLDLSGSMVDVFGNAFVLSKLNLLYVGNTSTSATRAASMESPTTTGAPFVDTKAVTVPFDPFYFQCSTAGITITNSTGDIVNIKNLDASAAATFEVLILGS